jgi:hypothetical protein
VRLHRLLVGATLVVILYLYTNAIFSFFTPGEQRELFRFIVLGAPIAVLLFLFPRLALVFLALFVYFVDWLALWVQIVPREFTWFIDLTLVILLARYFMLFPRLRVRPIPTTEKWIWALLVFAIFSAVINHVSTTVTLIGLRLSLKYLLLFIVLYSMDFGEKFNKGLFYFLFVIALVQIPVALIELTLVPAKALGLWDLITGTFGHNNTGILAVYLLGWIAFLVAVMLEKHRVRPGLLFLIILLAVPPVLGEVKAFFIVLIPFILFMLRREWKRQPVLSLAVGAFAFLLFVGVDYILVETGYWKAGRNPITYITSMGKVIEKDLAGPRGMDFGRFLMMKNALRFATSSRQAAFFGFGPGTATRSFFTSYEAPSVKYFRNWGISSDSHSLAWAVVEYGFLGTLLFLVPPFLLYRRSRILHQSDREDYRILASAFQGMTFLYIANLFVTPLLQSDPIGYFYWFTAAVVTRLSYEVEAKLASVPSLAAQEAPAPLPQGAPA